MRILQVNDNQEETMEQINILNLISKLLILVITCGIFTLILISVVIIRFSKDQFYVNLSTIYLCSFALDTYFIVFAVYSQFGFGETIYNCICESCHNKMVSKWNNKLQMIDNVSETI